MTIYHGYGKNEVYMNKNGHGYLHCLTFSLYLMMIPVLGLPISRGLWPSTGQLRESWPVAEYWAVEGIVACGLWPSIAR